MKSQKLWCTKDLCFEHGLGLQGLTLIINTLYPGE